jgi:hypothetical protein
MAKKKTQQRRVPRATDARMYGDGKPSQAAQQAAGVPATASATARPVNGQVHAVRVPVTVTTNYDYVRTDLRRLSIVAASIFAVLIVAGLIVK